MNDYVVISVFGFCPAFAGFVECLNKNFRRLFVIFFNFFTLTL